MEGLNPLDILIYIINFALTFAILYLLLYKPLSNFMQKRKAELDDSFKLAETKQQEADELIKKAQAELAAMSDNARELSHRAIETAALDAVRITDNAEDEAKRIISKAKEQIQSEKQAAFENAHGEFVSLATDIASGILKRETSLDDNKRIATAFFEAEEAK